MLIESFLPDFFFCNDSVSDFIIYKLKEMGKISQKDILIVMKEFDELDVDQSGTLSNVDVQLAQLSEQRPLPRPS